MENIFFYRYPLPCGEGPPIVSTDAYGGQWVKNLGENPTVSRYLESDLGSNPSSSSH